MRSPIYWNATVYRWTMRALYGDALAERYNAVLPFLEGTVLDLCAGDGAIAAKLPGNIKYVPADANEMFVAHLRAKGFPALQLDVREAALPPADVVLMMGSLCHMAPGHVTMVERMKNAARKRAIVVEPYVNWSASAGMLGKFAQLLSDPGVEGAHLGRLSARQIDELAEQTKATRVLTLTRERVLIWES